MEEKTLINKLTERDVLYDAHNSYLQSKVNCEMSVTFYEREMQRLSSPKDDKEKKLLNDYRVLRDRDSLQIEKAIKMLRIVAEMLEALDANKKSDKLESKTK